MFTNINILPNHPMVHNRNLVVIALASILVGAVAGIGALQYAQIVSMSGMNPSAAKEVTLEKKAPTCVNPRSIMLNLITGKSIQRPCPTVDTSAVPAENQMHGAPSVVEPEKGCAATDNTRRRIKCNEDVEQGAVQGLKNDTIR